MRFSPLLSAVVAVAALVACTANADSDQYKILTIKSSDFVHPVDIGHKNDGTARRLRRHQQNEELEMEERMDIGPKCGKKHYEH
ncbi:LOW QUALITY PROTEIN: Avirulence (Avh) protein [Phytophthora megakarya]|uniref:RxLR effector protein n=1 Tax=Phytophthora megakarya TaxID=4795 RepID=A0A225UCQ3_9STRA|nr:LOW QUALITY PROTEIN: Avirulence (Avh) protein [Phytophthora megakarya]